MKKILPLLLSSLFFGQIFGQNVLHLKYRVRAEVNTSGLLGAIETETPDHEEPNLDRPDEGTVFRTQLDKISARKTPAYQEQEWHFYANDTLVRWDKNTNKIAEDEFILIAPKIGKMQVFYTNADGKIRYNERDLKGAFEATNIRYEVDTFERKRKKILDYDCYEVAVRKLRKGKNETWQLEKSYRLFVTEELSFSAGILLNNGWFPVRECALEVYEISEIEPSIVIVTKAMNIAQNQDNQLLAKPQRFKKATKKSYLSDF